MTLQLIFTNRETGQARWIELTDRWSEVAGVIKKYGFVRIDSGLWTTVINGQAYDMQMWRIQQ